MCSRHDFLRDIEKDLYSVAGKVTHPFNVAVFGKMKRGKSSLVNALLGSPLAITDQTEATATINVVSYASPDSDLLKKFEIHWKDEPPQTFPLTELKKWTGPDGQFDRIKYIQLYSHIPSLQYHEIIDTPGTESVVQKHQKIAEDFINPNFFQDERKADALIYVFGYNVEDADLKYLRMYQQHASSESYNVLGILHCWDAQFVNNLRTGGGARFEDIVKRAECKRAELGGLVTDVIPVSAPLAIFVNLEPVRRDDLLERAIRLLGGTSDRDMYRFIMQRGMFLSDPERSALWNDIVASTDTKFPDATAWVILIEAARSNGSVADLVERLRLMSGIDCFQETLDRSFFSRSELIRQRRINQDIQAVAAKFRRAVKNRQQDIDTDSECWAKLASIDLCDNELRNWAYNKKVTIESEREDLLSAIAEIDGMFINSDLSKISADAEILELMGRSKLFAQADIDVTRSFLDVLHGVRPGSVDMEKMERVVRIARRGVLEHEFSLRDEAVVQHLQERFLNFEQ